MLLTSNNEFSNLIFFSLIDMLMFPLLIIEFFKLLTTKVNFPFTFSKYSSFEFKIKFYKLSIKKILSFWLISIVASKKNGSNSIIEFNLIFWLLIWLGELIIILLSFIK